MDGSGLVLEADGTEIDNGVVLKMLHKETLILLSQNERWSPENSLDISLSSGASTITVDACENANEESASITVTADTDENVSKEIDFNLSSAINEDTWESFTIPWQLLGKSRLAECKNGTNVHNHVHKLIQVTIDAVRDVTKHPGCKALKILAKKIVNENPHFRDMDEDNVPIGSGYSSIFKKLLERNNYLNRPHKRPLNCISPHELPPSKIKVMMSSKAGK